MEPGGFGQPSDALIAVFREAAGWAAAYELAMRMLADRTSGLEALSLAKSFQQVEDAVRAHFKVHLTQADDHLLDNIRPIRNKLLHGELRTARERMAQMGHPPGPQRISKAVLPPLSSLTLESFAAAVESAAPLGENEPQEGNLFGWLLQSVTDGSLAMATSLFRKALALVERLARAG